MRDLSVLMIWLFFFACSFAGTSGNRVFPGCEKHRKECTFDLVIQEHFLMTTNNGKSFSDTSFVPFTVNDKRKLVPNENCEKINVTDKSVLSKETRKIETGDGYHKLVYLFNESLPGPAFVVYRDQQVAIRVTNNLQEEVTSVHWHGQLQRNTPWMDGVPKVSQNPIRPGESFTYRFFASTVGTFWYHSHYELQRTMGAYGPLIVLEKDKDDEKNRRKKDYLPKFEEEFYMVVSDWFEKKTSQITFLTEFQENVYYRGFDISEKECFKSSDKSSSLVPWRSALINGKGRHHESSDDSVEIQTPLETFYVKRGKKYRFRLISASLAFYLRVSIDKHKMYVIGSDGSDLVTTEVESIIIGSGERYDFYIKTNERSDSYHIRVVKIDFHARDGEELVQGHGEGILRYVGHNQTPTSERMKCTKGRKCVILNCPLESYFDPLLEDGGQESYQCLAITDLRQTGHGDMISGENMVQHVLNFHLTVYGSTYRAGINGFINRLPSTPLQLYGNDEILGFTKCSDMEEECFDKLCECSHIIDIALGSVVQLVLAASLDIRSGNADHINSHPIHFHGYQQQLLKMYYPTMDGTTDDSASRLSPDLECLDTHCNKLNYTKNIDNEKFRRDGLPFKDTIIIPVGGYVVTRFKADSPGYWLIHCHMEYHNALGMSVILKVGNFSQMNPAPEKLTNAGTSVQTVTVQEALTSEEIINKTVGHNNKLRKKLHEYKIGIYVLVAVTLVFIIITIVLGYHVFANQRHGYMYSESGN